MTNSDPRRRLLALSMTAAAICLVLGHLWNTPSTLTASRYVDQVTRAHGQFLAATLLTVAAALLLVPSAYGVARLLVDRSPRLAVIGATIAAVGAAGLAVGVSVIGFTMGMLTGHDASLARTVFDIASKDQFVSIPLYLAPLFSIGMLVLAIGLIRARKVALWQPILVIVGLVAAFGAPAGGLPGAIGHMPLAVGLVMLALPLWQGAAAENAVQHPAPGMAVDGY